MRISAIQLRVDDEEGPSARQQRVFEIVRVEASRGADLVILPEMWPVGFFAFDRYGSDAESVDGPLTNYLAQLARECGVMLHGGSFVERSGGVLHNTSIMFDRDGHRLATYRKVHLFPYGSREAELLDAGTEAVTTSAAGATFGLATCFDLRFPELFRTLVGHGAELFVVVAAWPFPRLIAWQTLIRARAIENQAAIIACNCAGKRFLGASQANDAWGSSLGELSERPGVLRCNVDFEAVRAAREEFPALAARRFNIPAVDPAGPRAPKESIPDCEVPPESSWITSELPRHVP